jgi:hypothetical protein
MSIKSTKQGSAEYFFKQVFFSCFINIIFLFVRSQLLNGHEIQLKNASFVAFYIGSNDYANTDRISTNCYRVIWQYCLKSSHTT